MINGAGLILAPFFCVRKHAILASMRAHPHIFILAIICLTGCDIELRSWIDEELRANETRRVHAATYLGVGTTQRAYRIADRMARSASEACSRMPPTENEFSLVIKRLRGAQPEVLYRETRTYREGTNGMSHLLQEAEFDMLHGSRGYFRNEVLVSKDSAWVRDDRSDRWYVRERQEEERRARTLGTRQMQILLNALPGLERSDGTWVLGAKKLRCEAGLPPELSDAWLARLEGRGKVREAKFRHESPARRRSYRAVWQLEDGRELLVEASENWSYGPGVDMLPPNEALVVDVERDRSLYLAQRALNKLIQDGIVERETDGEK